MVYGEFSYCFIVQEADIQRSSSHCREGSCRCRHFRKCQQSTGYLLDLFFLYGVIETARGKIPLTRAIPAGAFLLLFIGIFGWSAYRMRRAIN
jgi:hypothetical protein